jgi:hypothetical protein
MQTKHIKTYAAGREVSTAALLFLPDQDVTLHHVHTDEAMNLADLVKSFGIRKLTTPQLGNDASYSL